MGSSPGGIRPGRGGSRSRKKEVDRSFHGSMLTGVVDVHESKWKLPWTVIIPLNLVEAYKAVAVMEADITSMKLYPTSMFAPMKAFIYFHRCTFHFHGSFRQLPWK